MIKIRQFVMSGGVAMDDVALGQMLADLIAGKTRSEQQHWLKELDLTLDGYGGVAQSAAVARVRVQILRMEQALATPEATTGPQAAAGAA
jgi:hypothetical protein